MKQMRIRIIALIAFIVLSGIWEIARVSAGTDNQEELYGSKSENIALAAAAYASSNQRGDGTIGSRAIRNLTDGDFDSFIVLHKDDVDPWYYVDLGNEISVNKIVLYQGKAKDTNYQNAYASRFTIEYTNDISKGFQNAVTASGTSGKNVIHFSPVSARYLRVHVNEKAGINSMLYEMQVYETDFNSTFVPEDGSKEVKILFIGNSLTHYNDVAGKVRALYESAGWEAEVTTIIRLGQSLVYHASFEDTKTTILEGGYDYVVLQDKASNFDGSALMNGVLTINEWIQQTRAKTVLYMPWANENILASAQKDFTKAYTAAAKAVDAILAPAGEAYYELYFDHGCHWYSDNVHGTDLASFVSASTLFYTISGVNKPLQFQITDPIIKNNNYDIDIIHLIQEKASKYAEKFRDLSSLEEEEVSNGSNLALNKPCVSSGIENGGTLASNLTDGNYNTRWSSEHNDRQWIYVDLLKSYTVDKITLHWENAYAKKYDILISEDGINWRTVLSIADGKGGAEEWNITPVTARFIKLEGAMRALPYGYSIWEMEVYGESVSSSL